MDSWEERFHGDELTSVQEQAYIKSDTAALFNRAMGCSALLLLCSIFLKHQQLRGGRESFS